MLSEHGEFGQRPRARLGVPSPHPHRVKLHPRREPGMGMFDQNARAAAKLDGAAFVA
jgi:hypothetical protein